jgi:RNA polymerase sigma factor (sigma-70 family)
VVLDTGAFSQMYTQTAPAVRRYLTRRLPGAGDDVDDLLVETYLVAWRRRRVIPEGAELPWLYGVARRCLANHLRGERRRVRLFERLRAQPLVELPAPELADEALGAALSALTPTEREILLLVGWEGLTVTEAASSLGIRADAARARLHRARARITSLLEPGA